MSGIPRLSIGLPVYNGERYLTLALDALLSQTYRDFELIIADNASTDATERICREYAARDPRITYIRRPENFGCVPNHNFVLDRARGELFKWAGHDDLYAPTFLARCIEVLDEHPEVVLCHAGKVTIDAAGKVTSKLDYQLATDSSQPSERFRSILFGIDGDDFYGVIRTDVLRRVKPHDSYHHAEHTLMAELALTGPFRQVPQVLYFRRDHPDRAERAYPTKRSRAANMDPRRASRWRHPTVRLLAEYFFGFVGAIRRVPLPSAERRRCYRHLARWLASRAPRGLSRKSRSNLAKVVDLPLTVQEPIDVDEVARA